MPNNDTSRRESDWLEHAVSVRSIGFDLHNVENEMANAGKNSYASLKYTVEALETQNTESPSEQQLLQPKSEMTENWYALFVRSRHEFATSEQLTKKGVEVLLPTVTRMQRWSDRGKAVTFPLFPGYLFVHFRPSAETFLNVVKTHGTVSFVSHEPGRPTPVDTQEIQALKLILAHGEEIDVYPHLWEGARVAIKHGPLKGAIGILARKHDKHVFVINVEILGRSIGMKIDADELELV
jgi:transcription antitermination factor NusG